MDHLEISVVAERRVDTPCEDFTALQDAVVPEGHDTAFGYFSRTNPEAVDFLYDPAADIAEDHFALLEMTLRHGKRVVVVDAPTAIRSAGVAKTLAFPEEVLWRFYQA